MDPNPSIIYFIAALIFILAGLGFITEFFACRVKAKGFKFVPVAIGMIIFIISAAATGNFENTTGVIGVFTLGEIIMLAINLIKK